MSYSKKCLVCKSSFEARVSHKECCSQACRNIYSKEYHKNLYYSNREKFNKKCLTCSNNIVGKADQARYCSDKCASENNHNKEKIKNKTNKICEYCSKEFLSH